MTLLLPAPDPQNVGTPLYDIEIVPDIAGTRHVFVASHPELPGCMSDGESIEDALSNLADARALYVRALRDRGLQIPEGKADASVYVMTSIEPAGPTVGPVEDFNVRWDPVRVQTTARA